MAETREQRKARLEREGWREYKPGRFSRVNKDSEHTSVDSIMQKHYSPDSNISAVDAQISQMEGDTPGGNK